MVRTQGWAEQGCRIAGRVAAGLRMWGLQCFEMAACMMASVSACFCILAFVSLVSAPYTLV